MLLFLSFLFILSVVSVTFFNGSNFVLSLISFSFPSIVLFNKTKAQYLAGQNFLLKIGKKITIIYYVFLPTL